MFQLDYGIHPFLKYFPSIFSATKHNINMTQKKMTFFYILRDQTRSKPRRSPPDPHPSYRPSSWDPWPEP